MSKIIELNGKLYKAYNPHDNLVFTPDHDSAMDITGQTLKVGTKVAWGTGYRGGSGAVVGEITEIGWSLQASSIYEVDADGKQLFETRTGKNWRGDEYTYQSPITVPSEAWRFRVVTKSLMKGRKGNSFNSPNDVVAIAEQAFGER